jgi:ketosteroid isomerase-like protein
MLARFTKFTSVVMVLWLVTALISACQPVRPVSELQAAAQTEEEKFLEAAMGLEEAYQRGDIDAVVDYYAEDAVSHAPGFPTDAGQEAIRIAYQSFFDAYEMDREFELSGIEMQGDFAIRHGEWSQVLTPKDGSEPITETGRCAVAFQKIDGEWKVVWEIWNTY